MVISFFFLSMLRQKIIRMNANIIEPKLLYLLEHIVFTKFYIENMGCIIHGIFSEQIYLYETSNAFISPGADSKPNKKKML